MNYKEIINKVLQESEPKFGDLRVKKNYMREFGDVWDVEEFQDTSGTKYGKPGDTAWSSINFEPFSTEKAAKEWMKQAKGKTWEQRRKTMKNVSPF